MTDEVERRDAASRRTWSALFLGLNLALSAIAFSRMETSGPEFLRRFNELNVSVPATAHLVLSRGYLLVLPVLGLLSVLKEFLVPAVRTKLILNAVHLGLIVLTTAAYLAALYGPLIDAMQKMR